MSDFAYLGFAMLSTTRAATPLDKSQAAILWMTYRAM